MNRMTKSLVVPVVFVLAALFLVGRFTDFLPPLDNPFREKTVDRTGPSVLYSLTDLSEFHAASAYYETVVSIEKDTSYLPDWVSGEEVLYVGKGSVDAIADFGELDERRVVVSEDGTSVTITLPAPTVGEPVLDLEGKLRRRPRRGPNQQLQGVRPRAGGPAQGGRADDCRRYRGGHAD